MQYLTKYPHHILSHIFELLQLFSEMEWVLENEPSFCSLMFISTIVKDMQIQVRFSLPAV